MVPFPFYGEDWINGIGGPHVHQVLFRGSLLTFSGNLKQWPSKPKPYDTSLVQALAKWLEPFPVIQVRGGLHGQSPSKTLPISFHFFFQSWYRSGGQQFVPLQSGVRHQRVELPSLFCVASVGRSIVTFFPPTAGSFGVSAQIGSGGVRGGPEVRFHEGSTIGFHQGSTRVPPGFHQGSTRVPPGFHQGSTRVPRGFHEGSTRVPRGFHEGSTRVPQGSGRATGWCEH